MARYNIIVSVSVDIDEEDLKNEYGKSSKEDIENEAKYKVEDAISRCGEEIDFIQCEEVNKVL